MLPLGNDLRALEKWANEFDNRIGTIEEATGIRTPTVAGSTLDTEFVAGTGMSGGGFLSYGLLTFNVGAGTGITVNADTIELDAAYRGANPTATIGLSTVNGVATSYMRSDAAPALNQSIVPTWTGVHTYSAQDVHNAGISLGTSGQIYSSVASSGSNVGVLVRYANNLNGSATREWFRIDRWSGTADIPALSLLAASKASGAPTLRLYYDSTNYVSCIVTSTGTATWSTAGTTPIFQITGTSQLTGQCTFTTFAPISPGLTALSATSTDTALTLNASTARTTGAVVDFQNGGATVATVRAAELRLANDVGLFAYAGLGAATYPDYGHQLGKVWTTSFSSNKEAVHVVGQARPTNASSNDSYAMRCESVFDSSTVDSQLSNLWGGSFLANFSGSTNGRDITSVSGGIIGGQFLAFATQTGTGATVTNMMGGYFQSSVTGQNITVTNAHGLRVIAPSALGTGSSITNAYGIYVEEQTRGGTINNEVFIAGAGGVWFRDQALYIESTADGHLDLYADTSIDMNGDVDMSTVDLITDTTTGTKIATNASQKIGFWAATPIVQPTTAVAAATFTANTSGIANDTATFDGYTIGQVVKALRNEGLLA